MKKTLHLAFLVLLFSVTALRQSVAQDFTVGKLKYAVNSDGTTVTVTGHVDGTAATGELTIPALVSHDGTTYSVTVIGESAFERCSGLTGNLVIPNSVKIIKSSAFSGCYMLTGELTIPNSVVTIETYAFASCRGFVGNLIIPNSVISIGDGAFGYCNFTGELTIHSKVREIGERAFCNCQFSAINVDPTNKHYKSINGILFSADEKTLMQYPVRNTASSYSIPNTVTRIDAYAFYGCESLTNIHIPASVNKIGRSAFDYTGWLNNQEPGISYLDDWCLGWKTPSGGYVPLTGALVIREGTKRIADYAFFTQREATSLTLPNSLISIGDFAFFECSGFTGNLVLPEALTTIGDYAFWKCYGFTGNLVLPEALTAIGHYAFYNCTGFTGSLVIPNSVTTIGTCAFGCELDYDPPMGFTGDLVIPNSVTSIGSQAFMCCQGITSISIPESVTAIGSNAFYGTGWYEEQPDGILYKDHWYLGRKNVAPSGTLILAEGTRGIADYAFSSSVQLTGELTIPNSVVYIGQRSFYNCQNLTGSLTIPNSVKEIGEWAFYNCEGFDGPLTLGNSLETIGSGAFSKCENLSGTLVLPNSLTTLYDFAFYGCTGFTGDLIIPNSLTVIREGTFSYFTEGIMGFDGNLVIPETITEIYDQAFCSCVNLKSVTVSCATPPEIIKVWPNEEEDVFYGINKAIPVYVTCGSTNAFQSAEVWNQFSNFQELFPYNLTVQAIDSTNCAVSIVQQPSCDQQAIVKAEPAEGYVFVAWEEDGNVVSNDSVYTFTVDHDIHLMARIKSNIGVSESFEASATVYPNPTVGKVSIETKGLKHITISNKLGQVVYQSQADGDVFEYNFGAHEAGIYLIQLETANGVTTKRLVVTE